MPYVPALDGLRAVAVTLVFLGHSSGERFPGGWIGVDIFFVLSGYLITSILVREHETTGIISLSRFYLRRACRLLPALVVVVCVSVAMAFWFHRQSHDSVIDAVAALLYVCDYRYVIYPVVGGTPLSHTWSLSVEEQFYLVWPLLLIALLAWDRRMALFSTLVLIVVIALWRAFQYATSADPIWRVYFAFDTRADELLIGCALALWQPQTSPSGLLKHLWPLALLLFTAVVLNVAPTGRWLPFTSNVGYPLFGLAAAYLIFVLTTTDNLLTRLLSFPLIVAFGRISYGFYLWHWPLVYFHADLNLNRRSIVFAAALAAAMASYWLIERPFLKLGRRSKVSPRPPLRSEAEVANLSFGKI